jgi:hypothetical protein
MNAIPNDFSSRQAVEAWIESSLASGLSVQLIFTVMQKKSEELKAKREFYLLQRREALVKGNTQAATELHLLMKESEQQSGWFAELSGDLLQLKPQQKIMKETKNQLVEGRLINDFKGNWN